jgi:hypothetical protein
MGETGARREQIDVSTLMNEIERWKSRSVLKGDSM